MAHGLKPMLRGSVNARFYSGGKVAVIGSREYRFRSWALKSTDLGCRLLIGEWKACCESDSEAGSLRYEEFWLQRIQYRGVSA